MNQIHTIDGIEVAIQFGALIPAGAKAKSRHRFWIGKHRVDAYLSVQRILYVHWLNRATGEHEHPRGEGGMIRAMLYEGGQSFYYYASMPDKPGRGWTKEFRPSIGLQEEK